ncbi:MAG: 1,3--beta-D-glucan 3-glucanohydrolase, partial [Paenibacillaceae bacterium]|nr:1,3--beta-D-glucan 3-glucanohydrolase [Paenibacillaceae bacterium]
MMLKRGKPILLFLLFTLLVVFVPAPSTTSAAPNWKLVWSDEFNGSSLNRTYWTPEIGTGTDGWGNKELQYYTD